MKSYIEGLSKPITNPERKWIRRCAIAVVVGAALIAQCDAFAELKELRISLAFTPPHNEQVIAAVQPLSIARYRLELNHTMAWGRFSWEGINGLYGVNPWRHPDVVGHWPSSIGNSDWTIDSYEIILLNRLFWKTGKHTRLLFENRKTSFDNYETGSYWNYVGIEWRLK